MAVRHHGRGPQGRWHAWAARWAARAACWRRAGRRRRHRYASPMTAAAERRSPYCAAKAVEPARAQGTTYTVRSSARARWPRAYR
eukprot:5072536-Prymnesium_polylepis.1